MIGSLFSGFGGLELGLSRSTGLEVAYQVEIDPFCRRVLSARFPEARQYDDVKTFLAAGAPDPVLVCGGFPCQDLSVAGQQSGRTGLDGSRSGLWSEFERIIAERPPPIVVVENVAHGWRKWVPCVRGSLGRLGYASVPLQLSAAEVGAPHERRRVFVVAAPADTHGERLRILAERFPARRSAGGVRRPREALDRHDGAAWVATWSPTWPARPDVFRVDDGVPDRMERRRGLGNAVVVACAEVIGWFIVDAGLLREGLTTGSAATKEGA